MNPSEAKAIQLELVQQVSQRPAISLRRLRWVGGADVSYERRAKDGYAAFVVCSFPDLEVVEVAGVEGKIDFPYIPGLLSFRELPLLEQAWKKLRHRPEILICDGQGRAHPRRFGLACHVGVALDIPTVGCGKSRLIGEYSEPGLKRGNMVGLYEGKDLLGRVVRTRDGIKPLYVSVGHRVSLEQAARLVLNLCRGYRQPEVIRYAHREVNRLRIEAKSR